MCFIESFLQCPGRRVLADRPSTDSDKDKAWWSCRSTDSQSELDSKALPQTTILSSPSSTHDLVLLLILDVSRSDRECTVRELVVKFLDFATLFDSREGDKR